MQNHCIAREKNISSAFCGVWFYFWKLLHFLVVSICGFMLAAVSVVPVTPAQGHLFIQGWRKALGSSDMEEVSFQLFHLWDEGRTTGATPAVCFHPPWHASERAWISVRINVIFQDLWLTSRCAGSRTRPSVLYFGSAVLRKGQGGGEKVFKVNTRVVPPEFSKSVSDLWATADGCELFMSGFWDDFNCVYFFPFWRILTRM